MAKLNSCCWTRQPSSGHVFEKFIKENSVIYRAIILFFYISVTYGEMFSALHGRKMHLFIFASVVGIATVYGLDGPEFESRCWRDIPQLSIVALGPTQPPIPQVPGLSRGYSGRFVALTTHHHLAPRVKSTAIPLLPTVGLHDLFCGELTICLFN